MATGENDFVLADDGVLVHIGPHKTGTTAIQGALAAARPQLAEAGILYPGPKLEHNRQAAAAIRRAIGWDGDTIDRSRWFTMTESVRSHDGRTVLSSEVFCEASAEAATQVVADLDPERVRIVVTLRPLERLLPSSWQQYIKSGYRVTYEDWLENVLESREKRPITPSFWVRNNHPAVIRRWIEAVGSADKVAVVIADRSRPRSLFDSFEAILQLPSGTLEVDKSLPSNRSLTAVEAELLRQFNQRAYRNVSSQDYEFFVKRRAVHSLVEGRVPAADEPRITTPAWAIHRARELSKSDVAEIGELGVHVFGDLEALAPVSQVPDVEVQPVTSVPVSLAAELTYGLLEPAVQARADALEAAAARAAAVITAVPTVPQRAVRRARRLLATARSRVRRQWAAR